LANIKMLLIGDSHVYFTLRLTHVAQKILNVVKISTLKLELVRA